MEPLDQTMRVRNTASEMDHRYRQIDGMMDGCERLLLNHANTPGFLAPGGEEFNPGPETRLDRSELLCNSFIKV